MLWCPTGPTSLRLKILENGKTHKQSPRRKMPGKDQSWDESWQKKGNRGIVLTDVPRSQLDFSRTATRLSYPLIVGNLLLASDNTNKKCKSTRIHKNPFSTNYSAIFFARSMCTNILSQCQIPDDSARVKDII